MKRLIILIVYVSIFAGCARSSKPEPRISTATAAAIAADSLSGSFKEDVPLFSVDPRLVYTPEQLKGSPFEEKARGCDCRGAYDAGYSEGYSSGYDDGYRERDYELSR